MKDMKTIDDFIRQHAADFDGEEPDTGHVERFRSKQQAADVHRLRLTLFRIAAVVLLGMVLSYLTFREWRIVQGNLNVSGAVFANPELQEAENFYHLQLSQQYSLIQKLPFHNDPAEKKAVLKEFEAIDGQVQDMMRDLRQSPDDERIVNAIFNFYQMKIEAMDRIITLATQKNSSIL
jgi:hypothetical protein